TGAPPWGSPDPSRSTRGPPPGVPRPPPPPPGAPPAGPPPPPRPRGAPRGGSPDPSRPTGAPPWGSPAPSARRCSLLEQPQAPGPGGGIGLDRGLLGLGADLERLQALGPARDLVGCLLSG